MSLDTKVIFISTNFKKLDTILKLWGQTAQHSLLPYSGNLLSLKKSVTFKLWAGDGHLSQAGLNLACAPVIAELKDRLGDLPDKHHLPKKLTKMGLFFKFREQNKL